VVLDNAAVPIRDDQGKVVRWFGLNNRITDHCFLAEATKILGSSLHYHYIARESGAAPPVPYNRGLGAWSNVVEGQPARAGSR